MFLTRNVTIEQGLATVEWDIALNEMPGAWTIIGRDAATGVAVRHTLDIAPR